MTEKEALKQFETFTADGNLSESQAFANVPMQEFICRGGKVIARSDIFERIMDDTIECDKGCFDMLPGDFYRAELVVNGKVSKEDFETWLNPAEMHWEAQIALLIGDEEYGRKFVDWDYIRDAADADEWLSFLRDLPQYADEADWDKLIKEGRKSSWEALVSVRSEFKDKYQEWNAHWDKIVKKYTYTTYFPPFNLAKACKHNDIEVVKFHLDNLAPELNKNYIYPMPPGFPAELSVLNCCWNTGQILMSGAIIKTIVKLRVNSRQINRKSLNFSKFTKEKKMTELEKVLDNVSDISEYCLECDFDNSEIEELLRNGVIKAADISQGHASDLLIDGVIDYEQYPFENFSSCEQLRQLEHGAISLEEFIKQADIDAFDEEEKEWFKYISEKLQK